MVTPTSDALLETTPRVSPRAPDFDYWNDKQGPGPRLMGDDPTQDGLPCR